MHNNLIKGYKTCIEYLNQGYDKVSCYKSYTGFCWYNFLWVTGKFLKSIPEPLKDVKDRWYYEHYLKGDVNKVKSLIIDVPIVQVY